MSFAHVSRNTAAVRRRLQPRGLTLIEILISTTITLIMIFAIVEIFEQVGSAVAQGRAAIEMSGQIRAAAHRVREDLRGLTVPVRPWPHSASAEGYFEYLEGPNHDATNIAANSILGDMDDVLCFTARSVDEPFTGRYNGSVIESQVAEIVWWTRTDTSGNVSLHRRVLLIRPDLNVNANGTMAVNASNPPEPNIPAITTTAALRAYYIPNDVSARFTANGAVANTLSDLTKRENRYCHVTTAFPFFLDVNTAANPMSLVNQARVGTSKQGDDVILTRVTGFDLKAYDPQAQIRNAAAAARALVPSDPGWFAAGAGTAIGTGAYVDLNYSRYAAPATATLFSGTAHALSRLDTIPNTSVYDTWSYHYEHDGVNQDIPLVASTAGQNWRNTFDQGTNGLDDNNANGPDDVLERETSPPYPVPLRGLQIKIRIYDPDSRQVREATVAHDFIPE